MERYVVGLFADDIREDLDLPLLELGWRREDLADGYELSEMVRGYRTLMRTTGGPVVSSHVIPTPGACPEGVGVLLRFAPFRCPARGSWKGPEVARRSRNVTDFVEMFRHWNAGRSQVHINEALNIDRKTIRKYLALDLGR